MAGIQSDQLPFPPMEYRILVGPTDELFFDNPKRVVIFPYIADECFRAVFDFGCGCGRVARQLALQNIQPERYLGIDLHKGMIEWCQQNLTPKLPHFKFEHHNVYRMHQNKRWRKTITTLPFPAKDREFTLVNATSVFTHLVQDQAEFYHREVARILAEDGVYHGTYFLFDRDDYPMMLNGQDALYINLKDPSFAVIFAKNWIYEEAHRNGLKVIHAIVPALRGGQWVVVMAHQSYPAPEVELPESVNAPVERYYEGEGKPLHPELKILGLQKTDEDEGS